jgi:lipopolysaccharide/colanic/teichoic acid biosynthesis glycosyltransferase
MQEPHAGIVAKTNGEIPELLITPRNPGRWYFCVKRTLDLLISLAAILFFLPLMIIIGIAVFLDSPGPVLFRQVRVGKDGAHLVFYKFRSMRRDAEDLLPSLTPFNEAKGPIFKIQEDPRITRVGKFLRIFSLDELPQLLNVLRGEISLVGPRPQLPEEVKEYKPWQRQRLCVQPGIICFREVCGRSKLSFDEWIQLDLEYIANRDIWLDLKILLKVIPAILFHDGAC